MGEPLSLQKTQIFFFGLRTGGLGITVLLLGGYEVIYYKASDEGAWFKTVARRRNHRRRFRIQPAQLPEVPNSTDHRQSRWRSHSRRCWTRCLAGGLC